MGRTSADAMESNTTRDDPSSGFLSSVKNRGASVNRAGRRLVDRGRARVERGGLSVGKNLADSACRGGGSRYPCTDTVLTMTRRAEGARGHRPPDR